MTLYHLNCQVIATTITIIDVTLISELLNKPIQTMDIGIDD
jgi:hypothetical protein